MHPAESIYSQCDYITITSYYNLLHVLGPFWTITGEKTEVRNV